jgi:hypothetical protein
VKENSHLKIVVAEGKVTMEDLHAALFTHELSPPATASQSRSMISPFTVSPHSRIPMLCTPDEL